MRNHFPLDHEQKLGCNGCIQTKSAENYLETILILSKSHPVVRSVDVAAELGFKKSSVSVAMKKLRETDQITVSPEGYLYLTESGLATAEKIYERHLFLSEWLEKLGVNPVVAASDACKIEHVISSEVLQRSRNILISTV